MLTPREPHRTAVLAALCFAAAPATTRADPAPGSTLEVFVRDADSPPSRTEWKRTRVQVIDLDKEPLVEVDHADVQYDAVQRYRGVKLGVLLGRYSVPAGNDLAIVHFANGVAVPLPFRDDALMKRLDPLIARGMRGPDGLMGASFPTVARKVDNYADVKPLAFEGNKLVVAERHHPMVPPREQPFLSPWLLGDTVRSIELVQAAAYYRQFDVHPDSREAREGLSVFNRSCQFCHGLHGLGASFGVDFAEPKPIVDVKPSPRSLFFHVARVTRPAGQPQMPALSYLDQEDLRLLFIWLRATAERPLQAYKP